MKFDPSDTRSKTHREALRNNIDYLANLTHNRVVGYLGSCTDYQESFFSICMEYVSNDSLFSLLQKKGRLDLATTVKYTSQILEGIEYLHKHCIIHGNVWGRNIFIDPSLKFIKLSNLGISKQVKNLSVSCDNDRALAGKIKWMAPEIVIEPNNYGIKVDIWSVGCTVVEMLTKFPPWNNLTEPQVISKLKNGEYPVYDILEKNDKVDDFLMRCFEADPKHRPCAEDLQSTEFCQLVTEETQTTDLNVPE